MRIFDDYVAYLKDNPEGYWFKRKLYGFGWTPARWQGWSVTCMYIILILLVIYSSSQPNALIVGNDVVWPIIGLTLLFLFITWKKGEPLKWQWGIRKK